MNFESNVEESVFKILKNKSNTTLITDHNNSTSDTKIAIKCNHRAPFRLPSRGQMQ